MLGNSSLMDENEDVKKAKQFMETAAAQEGVDYHWISDYAKTTLWPYRLNVWRTLDEKAEAIIKYLGGGAGVFTLGVLATIDVSNRYLVLCSLPALVVSLVAIVFALIARKPRGFSGLPSVEEVKEYADDLKSEQNTEGAFLGHWHLACERARIACEIKAKWVERAAVVACVALGLLLLPVLIGVYTPPAVK